MIAKAIDKILDISDPFRVDLNGITFFDKKMYPVEKEHRADTLTVETLTGLVEYVKKFKEIYKDIPYLIHVESPTKVSMISALDGDRKREVIISAVAKKLPIPFGCYVDTEKMNIILQSMFIKDDDTDRDTLLKFNGTVTAGTIKDYTDDGVTQKAVIRQGVSSKADAIVPSPCTLRPFRTFHEVEQPASRFIFRMREGGHDTVESALFEADGGVWEREAMANIYEYLSVHLEGTGYVVIA